MFEVYVKEFVRGRMYLGDMPHDLANSWATTLPELVHIEDSEAMGILSWEDQCALAGECMTYAASLAEQVDACVKDIEMQLRWSTGESDVTDAKRLLAHRSDWLSQCRSWRHLDAYDPLILRCAIRMIKASFKGEQDKGESHGEAV